MQIERKESGVKPYFVDYATSRIRFVGLIGCDERVRSPRIRAQKLYVRFGGVPFIPFRIAHYATPAFYYSDLMRHRRKLDLDQGISKVRNGVYRAQEFLSSINIQE